MPYFLSDFIKQNPAVDLIIDVTNKTGVLENLELNQVDFALVSVLPKKLKIKKVELMQNKLFLLGSSQLNLNKPNDKKNLFENTSLIYREQGSATRNAMGKFIATNKFSVQKKIELTSNEAVKQAVISGLGCSIMPLIGVKNELRNNDLQIIPVKGLPIITTWNLIWLQSKKLSPVASAYLDFINSKKEEIINEKFSWINF
jgi:DNA-binding transcriptional LysR family regulator